MDYSKYQIDSYLGSSANHELFKNQTFYKKNNQYMNYLNY